MLKLESHKDFFLQVDTFCSLPFQKLVLTAFGTATMCCHQKTQLGNIFDYNNILELWRGDLSKSIREETLKKNIHPVCSSWNVCPFLTRKRVLNNIPAYKRMCYPTFLEICLPDKHCNVGGENPSDQKPACLMCTRNFFVSKQPDITDVLCFKSKSLMPYLTHLCVLGTAEPFWKDIVFRVFDILEFKRYKDNINFWTNTNGTLLNEKIITKFLNYVNCSTIRWSIDAATAETHKKLRRLDTYNVVLKNLKNWINLTKKSGNHYTIIANNINIINVYEMSKMVEVSCELGVDEIHMLPTSDQLGHADLSSILMSDKNIQIFKEESEKAKQMAKKLNVKLVYPMRFDVPRPNIN